MPDPLTTVQEIINAAEKATKAFNNATEVWWRGQAKATWDLIPCVYHQSTMDDVAHYERNITARFMRKARTRHSNCPLQDDFSGWLFFMQHHGLPTRLMDWSDSALVAAYFACRDEAESDAALWALNPFEFNTVQMGSHHIFPSSSHRSTTPCFLAPFKDAPPENSQKTMAISAHEVDIRMLVQSSEFTIHGTNTPLNKIENNERFLLKYVIPATVKPTILSSLKKLGIKESYLFPDLERLAAEIKTLRFGED